MNNETFMNIVEKYNIEWASEYIEPGYSTDKKGILFANWNNVPKKIINKLESEYEIEWEDEWSTCSNCGRAFRTSPNSYHWQGSYYLGEGEIFCLECLDWQSVLDDYQDNPRKALTWPLYDAMGEDEGLKEYGFISYNGEYENGFYPGQTDDPTEITNKIKSEYPTCHVLFAMTSQGQFDIAFKAFYKLED